MRLTDLAVRNLQPPERGQKAYRDDNIPGFSIRVSQGGTKTFTLMVGKDRQLITIGRYPVISLSEARTAAKTLLAERTLNRHRPHRLSFEDALALFITEKRGKNKARTIGDNERILRKYCVSLHRKNLEDLTTHDITRITDKLSDTPGTALHVFWSLRTFLRWCAKRRYLDRNPIEHLEAPAPIRRRDRVLTTAEVQSIWKTTEKQTTFNVIIRLCLLTGQRRGEIAAIQSSWLTENELTIPAVISKNGLQHSIPLSPYAKELATWLGETRYGMPPFSGWSRNKKALDAQSGVTDWVIHDCRRSYATRLQQLQVPSDVIESLLGHITHLSGLRGTYQRHRYEKEMREAVALYDAWFQQIILGKA